MDTNEIIGYEDSFKVTEQGISHIGHSVMVEDGMDVISCLATMEHERNPLIGESHGKYAYKPKYAKL